MTWGKALRKLDEATQMSPDALPGPVIVSSYFAMRHAAVAVLLHVDGKAPSAETQIIARFGAVVSDKDGYAQGEAFNRIFDLRNAEDYDAVAMPTADEARMACEAAFGFIDYCASKFGFTKPASPGP